MGNIDLLYRKSALIKKKIVFVCSNYYPQNIGGLEVFNHYLLNSLHREYDVNCLILSDKEIELPYPVIRLKEIARNAIVESLTILFWGLKLKESVTVVLSFARSHWMNWWVYPFLKFIGKFDYILIIHGGGLSPWKVQFFYQLLFRGAKKIYGVSDRICNEYNKRTNLPITKIYPLIPFEICQLSKHEARTELGLAQYLKIFLFVGSLKKLKNLDVLIDALAQIDSKILAQEKFVTLVLGDGPLLSSYLAKVDEAGLGSFFQFRGIISRETISKFYKAADVFIITSLFEGTPISLLEAIFNDLLVFAADSPGINQIVDTGYAQMFDPKDSEHLSVIIKKFLLNEQSVRYSTNSFNILKDEYDYEIMLSKIKDGLNNV